MPPPSSSCGTATKVDESGGFESWLGRNSNSSGAATGQITFGSDAQAVELPTETLPRMSWR